MFDSSVLSLDPLHRAVSAPTQLPRYCVHNADGQTGGDGHTSCSDDGLTGDHDRRACGGQVDVSKFQLLPSRPADVALPGGAAGAAGADGAGVAAGAVGAAGAVWWC